MTLGAQGASCGLRRRRTRRFRAMAFNHLTCAAAQPDQNRQDLLEWLYLLDGRDDPSHDQHACYTGLYMKTVERLGREMLTSLERGFHSAELGETLEPMELTFECVLVPTPPAS